MRFLAAVGDPDGTRTVTSIVVLLVALGVALVMLAIWLFKVTRPDPELLAPLEVMGERKWRRADPVWQRRRLDVVRPAGAEPLQPSPAPPDLDEAFERGPMAPGFDDLSDLTDAGSPAVPAVAIDPGLRQRTPEPASPPADPTNPQLSNVRLVPRSGSSTPTGIERPIPEDLPERPIDPALLAAAMAELDQELHQSPQE
jgi:hypothetical protein